jgi:hypothetical protein
MLGKSYLILRVVAVIVCGTIGAKTPVKYPIEFSAARLKQALSKQE